MTNAASITVPLQRIKQNLLTAFSSTVLAGVIGLCTTVVNARSLPVADLGVIATVQALALLISGITTLSTHLPLMRTGAPAIQEGRHGDLLAIIRFALILDICAGVLASVVALIGVTLLSQVLGLASFLQFGLALFVAPMLFGGLSSANGILRLIDRFDLIRIVEVGAALLLLVSVITLSLADASVEWYMAAYAAVFGLNPIARYVAARLALSCRFGRQAVSALGRDQRSAFVKFAVSSSVGATIDTLRNNLDVLTVSSLFGREGVGIFAVAKQAAGSIRKFAGLSTIVSFVEFSRMTAQGEYKERARLFRHVMTVSFALGLAAVGAVLLLGDWVLIHGFGKQFASGYWVLVVLSAAAAAQFLMDPVNMLVQIIRGAVPAMMCTLAGLGAFGLSILPLGWALGLEGVALASLLYFLVVILIGASLIRRDPAQRKISSNVAR